MNVAESKRFAPITALLNNSIDITAFCPCTANCKFYFYAPTTAPNCLILKLLPSRRMEEVGANDYLRPFLRSFMAARIVRDRDILYANVQCTIKIPAVLFYLGVSLFLQGWQRVQFPDAVCTPLEEPRGITRQTLITSPSDKFLSLTLHGILIPGKHYWQWH